MKVLLTGLLTLAAVSGVPAFAGHRKAAKAPYTDARAEKARRQILADLRLRGSNIPGILSSNGNGGR